MFLSVLAICWSSDRDRAEQLAVALEECGKSMQQEHDGRMAAEMKVIDLVKAALAAKEASGQAIAAANARADLAQKTIVVPPPAPVATAPSAEQLAAERQLVESKAMIASLESALQTAIEHAARDQLRAQRLVNFIEGSFHAFAPAGVAPTDATIASVMIAASRELKGGALADDPAAHAQAQELVGTLLVNSGNSAHATELLEQALAFQRAASPLDVREVADSASDLALAHLSVGTLPSAQTLAQEALTLEQAISIDSLSLARARSVLAQVLVARGDLAQATLQSETALAIYRKLLPGNTTILAEQINQLGEILDQSGRFADAERLYHEAVTMKANLYEGDHPNVARGLKNLAGIRQELGRSAEAEPLAVAALEMQRRIYTGDTVFVADGINTLASIRRSLGDTAGSEILFRQSLAMRERIYKGDHPSIASSLTSLAWVEQALGKSSLAEPMLVRALEMRKRLSSGDDARVARALNSLAWVRFDLAETAQAAQNVADSVAMYERLFPAGDAGRAVAIATQARIAKKLGQAELAASLILQAETMVLATESPAAANTQAVLDLKREIATH